MNVGLPTSVAAILASPLYHALLQQHPGIRINLIERTNDNLVDLLANGRLDMAVLFCETESRGIARKPILRESLSLYGRPETLTSWGIGETCTTGELRGRPLVLPGAEASLTALVQKIFTRSGSELSVVADIDSFFARLLLASTEFLGTVLSSSLRSIGATHGLDEVPIVEATGARVISLCWLTTTTPGSAAAKVTRDLIVETCNMLVNNRIWIGGQIVAG